MNSYQHPPGHYACVTAYLSFYLAPCHCGVGISAGIELSSLQRATPHLNRRDIFPTEIPRATGKRRIFKQGRSSCSASFCKSSSAANLEYSPVNPRTTTMVAFTHLAAIAVWAIAGTSAAPTSDFIGPAPRNVDAVEPIVSGDDAPDFEFSGNRLTRRQDYTQNYKTGGNVNFSPGTDGYSVTFSGAQDFVVGKGWKKGTER